MGEGLKVVIYSIIVMTSLGIILGLIIGVFAKFFAVEEDLRVSEVTKRLPGLNCGACGFPGCAGLADAIVNSGASPRLCKPGTMQNFEAIKQYLEETPDANGEIIKIKL